MDGASRVNAIDLRRSGTVVVAIAAVLLLAGALTYGVYVSGWLGGDASPASAPGREAGKVEVQESASEAPPVAIAAVRQESARRLADSGDGIRRTLTDDGLLLEDI